MFTEQWEEDLERRKAKEAELEKRTLAFRESYENGDMTEEEYQQTINQAFDFAEPQDTWVPIEEEGPEEPL
ncbi:hypothetical protein NRIC_18820 [Enterococcus florum]|uniref:Uncharacterized protein n=1 Tax=Enterococcus florum TaxID=2480627 RepID=A0A4P5PCI4_9ENTE|nr:hypothetical protein [Enterococcus florum]GCF93991.1 hypothetical protein NRIC_18820 [Enterococcus florum]